VVNGSDNDSEANTLRVADLHFIPCQITDPLATPTTTPQSGA